MTFVGVGAFTLDFGLYLRRSRVIGDSFSEFRHIESRKSKVCIALLAHDKGVCAVGELSVLCIIHVYVLVHLLVGHRRVAGSNKPSHYDH